MKRNLFFSASLLLIFFVFLTLITGMGSLGGMDLAVTKALQLIIPRVFDLPFSLLSLFGSLETVSIILFIILIIFRKLNYFYVLLNFALFHVIELFGKAFVTHPGPGKEFFRYFFSFSFPSSSVKPGSSYPSGHLGRTMFISIILVSLICNSKLTKLQKKL